LGSGLPSFHLGKKTKKRKKYLKEWERLKEKNANKTIRDLEGKMEEYKIILELELITLTLLVEEQHNFLEYQKDLRTKEEKWRLKSRSLWLQVRDKNTKFSIDKERLGYGKTK